MFKARPYFVCTIIVLSVLCSGLTVSGQEEDPLQIVASHNILADVVANVAGDAAEVTSLIPSGSDPHSFQPSARDIAGLVDADVVFVNGALFEEGLLDVIQNAADDINIVTASSCVEIIPFNVASHEDHEESSQHSEDDHDQEESDHGGNSDLDMLCSAHSIEVHDTFHEHGEHDHALGSLFMIDCEGGHEHDEEHDDHAEDGCDPHVWMNPENVVYWTLLTRDVLIELDPVNSKVYTANANTYIEALNALVEDEIEPMIATISPENRILVTNHDAFGYFAEAYDFEIVGTVIPGGSTLAEPSASDVAALIDTVREAGVQAIFAENTVSQDLADQVAAETGAQVYNLYSGSLSDADGPADTYINYMRYNITTIVETLSG